MNDAATHAQDELPAARLLAGPALSRPGRMPPPRPASGTPEPAPSATPAAATPAASGAAESVTEEPPVVELPEAAVTGEEPSAGAPAEDDPLAAALHEVAARLEGVAASLRAGSAEELLSGSSARDPLALLLTGFVLGHTGRGRAADETAGR